MINKVHIAGYGVLSPLGISAEEHIISLKEGKAPGLLPSTVQSLSGRIPPFNPRDYIKDRKALKVMSRQIITACIAAGEAVKNCPLSPEDSLQSGVVWGAPVSTTLTSLEDVLLKSCDSQGVLDYGSLGDTGYRQLPPLWIIPKLPNTTAGRLSINHGFKGINYSVVNGFNNGFIALGEAFDSIRWTESEKVLTGGSEEWVRGDYLAKLKMEDAAAVSSQGSLSFSPHSEGFLTSEASVCFLLESEESLKRRGGESHGSLLGYSNRTVPDIMKLTPQKLADSYYNVMKEALADAGMNPASVDSIQASGCGIPLLDKAEILAIKKLFPHNPPITSVCSAAGYALTASGPLSVITALLQLKEGFLAPLVRGDDLYEEDSLNYVRETIEFSGSLTLCNSFDFYGSAASLIIKK